MIRVSSANEDKRVEIILRLRRYRSRVAEYQAQKELYDSLFPSAVQVLNDMPKSQNQVYEPERWAQIRANQSERMEQSLYEVKDALLDVEGLVNCLHGFEKAVITRKYLLGETMYEITERIKISARSCARIHNRAIDTIVKKGVLDEQGILRINNGHHHTGDRGHQVGKTE